MSKNKLYERTWITYGYYNTKNKKYKEIFTNCGDIGYVCRKYHISRTSLWRWNKKYDGNKESLEDKSHRPLSKHPTAHTEIEMKWIRDLIKKKSTYNIKWNMV